MSVKVSIQLLDNYEPSDVHGALQRLLEPIGGMSSIVDASTLVLKPNFLAPRPVSKAVCTHPEIVRQTALIARTSGVEKVIVTDSPGIGSAVQCAKKLGLASNDTMEIRNPDDTEWISSKDVGVWKLHISKLMAEHPVINIAKMKTHGQMILTAAVKNMFGAVVGLEKAQWHYRIGRNPLQFAKLLVQIYQMIGPKLNILDGVVGMEGNGPGSGVPRELGFLAASENAHALDYVLCKILKIDPMKVYTIRAAHEMGVLPEEKDIEIVGAPIAQLHPNPDWRMAARASVVKLAGPNWMAPIFERLLNTTPLVNHSRCTMCLVCIQHCAAKAMDGTTGKIEIDRKKCISCFCCQEMCPHGAITVESGMLARVLGLGK